MSQSRMNMAVLPWHPGLAGASLYLATAAMVLGNLLLPMAVHRIPDGGRMLMPILFFTLVAGWRFGARAGLLTGLLSPLANHALTGMPAAPLLQGILVQSVLLGILASLAAAWSRGASPSSRSFRAHLGAWGLPALLVLVVLAHQGLVLLPRLAASGTGACLAALNLRSPGLLLQIVGGWAVLRLLGGLPGAGDGPRTDVRP
jgi:thiamine transporter ThiT